MSGDQTPLLPMPWDAPTAAPSPLLPATAPPPAPTSSADPPIIPLSWEPPPTLTPQPPGPWLPQPPLQPVDRIGAADREVLLEYATEGSKFREAYARREAAYEKCLDDAKVDQAKHDAEQARIDAEWNDPKKKRPAKKPTPKTSVKTCHFAPPKIACVPDDDNPQGQFGTDLGNALNKAGGTTVDFAQIAVWEGGVHLNAYHPWFPEMTKQPDGTFEPLLIERKGKAPRLDGMLATDKARNRSGVTVGKGIDFGPQGKDAYLKELEQYNKSAGILTADEMKAFKDKIGPYLGKTMAEACIYLRANPLTMTQKELDLLHLRAATQTLENTAEAYFKQTGKDFTKLPVEAQTALFSRHYQTGKSPSTATLDHIAAGNYATAARAFVRESAYLAVLGNAPPAAPNTAASP